MYSKPFGSIFGDSAEPLKNKAPAQQVKPLPSADPTQDPIKQQKEKLRKSRVIKPGDSAALDITTKAIPVTPELELAEATHEQKKSHLAFARIERALAAAKADLKKIEVYKAVLVQYHDLTPEEKAVVDAWVLKHAKAVKSFAKARRLIKQTKLMREKLSDIDIDIDLWDTLKNLKGEGKVMADHLKRVRSIQLRPEREVPKFRGERVDKNKKMFVRGRQGLEKLREIEKTLNGVFGLEPAEKEETPATASPRLHKLVKEGPKASLYTLPDGKRDRIEAILTTRSHHKLVEPTASKKAQRRWGDAKQLAHKKKALVAELNKLQSSYREELAEVNGLVEKINMSGKKAVAATATLGILTEGNPNLFLAAPTLIDSLNNFFKVLKHSQLHGDEDSKPKTPEEEAEAYLQKATMQHGATQQELQTREYALVTVQADVKDLTPPPPPPPIKIEVTVDTAPKGFGISMNHVLLALGGVWILSKVF